MNYKNVIITGAGGLLGSELIRSLELKNYHVAPVYHDDCDISDKTQVQALAAGIREPSLIVHCAAITNVDLCEKNKDLCSAVNIEGTQNICELADRTASAIIFISTASVFDGMLGNYKENDKTNPTNYYNLSKIKGE